jgi:hypothetical protein
MGYILVNNCLDMVKQNNRCTVDMYIHVYVVVYGFETDLGITSINLLACEQRNERLSHRNYSTYMFKKYNWISGKLFSMC